VEFFFSVLLVVTSVGLTCLAVYAVYALARSPKPTRDS